MTLKGRVSVNAVVVGFADELEALCAVLEVRPSKFAQEAIKEAIRRHLQDPLTAETVGELVRIRRRHQRRHLHAVGDE